jgi:hypothetical protein
MIDFPLVQGAQSSTRSALRAVEKLTSILTVSAYLSVVGCFLILTGRIRVSPLGFARRVLAALRPPFKGDLVELIHERGNCYVAPLARKLISDSNGRSRLKLFEDGQELPYPHSNHDDIREVGAGRYSHWGDAVFFSSSDNSDPAKNGRRYSVREI